jgi:hypothetical protein
MELNFRQRFRYHFDNLMARGTSAQIGMLFALAALLVLSIALVVVVFHLGPSDNDHPAASFPQMMWKASLHTIDTGELKDDTDNAGQPYVVMMLLMTLGGLFVVSAFIGIVNTGLTAKLEEMRKGKSLVAEKNHTVILGYTAKVHTLLSELAEANANQPKACVVVLDLKDKVEMDDEIAKRLPRKMKVVTRSGSPTSVTDLEMVNLPTAKSIIVMAPETDQEGERLEPHEADTVVLKTLLAINKINGQDERYHVVAELQDEKILAVSRMVAGEQAALLLAPPLISRLLVQTGRQTGLSAVFTELLDFGGSEIYIQPEPKLTGKTFRAALAAYDDTALIGVLDHADQLLLPPAMDYIMKEGDQVIAISEDDDTLIVNGKGTQADETSIVNVVHKTVKTAERNLVLGTSERLLLVLRALEPYCAPGSETLVVGEDDELGKEMMAIAPTELKSLGLSFRHGDLSSRELLDTLDVGSFGHVLVLSEGGGRTTDIADARTMVCLLHLRDIAKRSGKPVPVTSEILDIGNRDLAAVAEADDFVVSNTLVALMATQLSENRHLTRVFDELFTYGGHDLRIKPAADYVKLDKEVDYYTILESAIRKDEIAIGYRIGALGRDPKKGFGVVVNPKKHQKVKLGKNDQIVVMTLVS